MPAFLALQPFTFLVHLYAYFLGTGGLQHSIIIETCFCRVDSDDRRTRGKMPLSFSYPLSLSLSLISYLPCLLYLPCIPHALPYKNFARLAEKEPSHTRKHLSALFLPLLFPLPSIHCWYFVTETLRGKTWLPLPATIDKLLLTFFFVAFVSLLFLIILTLIRLQHTHTLLFDYHLFSWREEESRTNTSYNNNSIIIPFWCLHWH